MGWNTAADGSGANYADKQTVTDLASKQDPSITLYAQWKKDEPEPVPEPKPAPAPAKDVTVTYKANGGTGTMGKQTTKAGDQTTLNANAFTREGYSFDGWNTKADGTGAMYSDRISLQLEADLTLYAQWKKNVEPQTDVKVSFEANGGKGTMAKQTVQKGADTALNANAFTREGYSFNGWNTKADGKGTSYKDKASVKLDVDLTLYAQWKKNATSARKPTPGTGDPLSVVSIVAMAGAGIAAIATGRIARRRS